MGIRNYLIEGVSGAGKTTVAEELQRRGHHVIYGGRTLAYVGDLQTGEVLKGTPAGASVDLLDWSHRHWIWPPDRIKALVEDQTNGATFFCGGLFGLEAPAQPATTSASHRAEGDGSGIRRSGTEDGVTVPHGSKVRMEYLRGAQVFEGQFLNGRLVVDGQSFDPLSQAASAIAVTKDGTKTHLNGWNCWKVQFPGETTWRSLGEMRGGQ